MPPLPTQTAVATQTQTSTKTKVAAVGVGLLALGLAGYGFGFIPGLDLEQKNNPELAQVAVTEQQDAPIAPAESNLAERCQKACFEQEQQCLSSGKIEAKECYQLSGQCHEQCAQDFPVLGGTDMPPLPPESSPSSSGPALSTCELTAEARPNFRMPVTLVPGDAWQALAEYTLTASGDRVSLHRVGIKTSYDAASFTEVGVAYEGTLIGRGVLSSGSPAHANVTLFGSPTIPPGTSIRIQLWGRLANVLPSSTSLATSGVPRSGQLVNLGLSSGSTHSAWGSDYAGRYHLEANCGVGRVSTYAEAAPPQGGRDFIVRKSVLYIHQQPLSSTTLTSGQQDIYRFQASADASGSVSLKQLSWRYSYSASSPSSTIGSLRLFRSGSEVPRSAYRIVDHTGLDLSTQPFSPTSTTGMITLVFNQEEVISGSGHAYTLQAAVRSPSLGDTLSLDPSLTGSEPQEAGYLFVNRTGGITLDLSEPADATTDYDPVFVWSDQSEVPHSFRLGISGGSRDWIASLLEYNLRRQTLSR